MKTLETLGERNRVDKQDRVKQHDQLESRDHSDPQARLMAWKPLNQAWTNWNNLITWWTGSTGSRRVKWIPRIHRLDWWIENHRIQLEQVKTLDHLMDRIEWIHQIDWIDWTQLIERIHRLDWWNEKLTESGWITWWTWSRGSKRSTESAWSTGITRIYRQYWWPENHRSKLDQQTTLEHVMNRSEWVNRITQGWMDQTWSNRWPGWSMACSHRVRMDQLDQVVNMIK